jgi:hypothetical protein
MGCVSGSPAGSASRRTSPPPRLTRHRSRAPRLRRSDAEGLFELEQQAAQIRRQIDLAQVVQSQQVFECVDRVRELILARCTKGELRHPGSLLVPSLAACAALGAPGGKCARGTAGRIFRVGHERKRFTRM